MTYSMQQTTRDNQRGTQEAVLAGAVWGFLTAGVTSLQVGTVLVWCGPISDFVTFMVILSIAMLSTIAGPVLGAYCGSVLSRRTTTGTSQPGVWPAVLTGAVYGWVAFGLISLVIVAAWMIDERAHPLVWIFGVFIGLPTITIAGSVFGALCGLVVHFFKKKKRHIPATEPPRAISRLLLRSAFVYGLGVILIVSGTILWASVKYRPIAKLESLGGHLNYVAAMVRFPDGKLGDAELPAVVECLNETMEWHHLILSGTKVSGDGLRHLQSLSVPEFALGLSPLQLDEAGLKHLRKLQNLSYLCVTGGSVAPETRTQVQQALPNVQRIEYYEEFHLPD
jgi:hypothetical protein